MTGEIWGVAAVAVIFGGTIIWHTKAWQRWYDAHTTPTERLVVDEAAKTGLQALEVAMPSLDKRVAAIEAAIAELKAAAAPTTPEAPKGA